MLFHSELDLIGNMALEIFVDLWQLSGGFLGRFGA
jgi:hypothetical protein